MRKTYQPSSDGSVVIGLDSRRRLSLARIGNAEHTHYLVREREDGSILLTPLVVAPAVVGERPATIAPVGDGWD